MLIQMQSYKQNNIKFSFHIIANTYMQAKKTFSNNIFISMHIIQR